jgi:hypothetical protein
MSSQNSLHTIHPYRTGAALVFDDPAVGLLREALVGGTDLILDLAARMAGADPDHFALIFAEGPFPGHQAVATWIEKGEAGFGDWYMVALPGNGLHHGWLCPALLKYFPAAPGRIFFAVHPHERKSDEIGIQSHR